jgi:hypothetical protein
MRPQSIHFWEKLFFHKCSSSGLPPKLVNVEGSLGYWILTMFLTKFYFLFLLWYYSWTLYRTSWVLLGHCFYQGSDISQPIFNNSAYFSLLIFLWIWTRFCCLTPQKVYSQSCKFHVNTPARIVLFRMTGPTINSWNPSHLKINPFVFSTEERICCQSITNTATM